MPPPTTSLPSVLRSPIVLVALLAVVTAFAFLGTRNLWDPDEGRYTNVALNMLGSGDWIDLYRSDEVGHWTKPPLTYWAIAASVAAFGSNAWAARLPSALSYLLCVWLAWRIGRRLVPGAETQAALIYATMLLSFGASQLITTDYVLSACIGLAAWGFVEARFGARAHPRRWMALMWVGLGLGFLAKGPPALILLLPLLAFDLLTPGRQRPRLFGLIGLVVFALLALPWYLRVTATHPGLLQHFLGDEVVNRVASDQFGRHGEWYGWLEIYGPTLLIGTLPWTPELLRWAYGLPAAVRRWRDRDARVVEAPALLLALWVLVPLTVFCMARSRLPLYLLPAFLPLAIVAARQRQARGLALPRWPWIALWVALLLALKIGTALWPTHKDAGGWADEIRARVSGPVDKVVFVEDMARYGIHLHLGSKIEKISIAPLPHPQPGFNPEYDTDLDVALARRDPEAVWITKPDKWSKLQAALAAKGYRTRVLGKPYEGRTIFRIERPGQVAPTQ